MANQFNYPDTLANGFQRPNRTTDGDLSIISRQPQSTEQVLFGTTLQDVLEIWFYNPDGTFAGHITIPPTSEHLSHTSIIDQTGAYEVLLVDLQAIGLDANIAPGQYGVTMNMFTDQVGSEAGYKLYISAISPDRTELQLKPMSASLQVAQDIFEFNVPKVPAEAAKGLVDTIFGAATVQLSGSYVTVEQVNSLINSSTLTRIQNISATSQYISIMQQVAQLAYNNVVALLDANFQNNRDIDKSELEQYIQTGLSQAIVTLNSAGSINPIFNVV